MKRLILSFILVAVLMPLRSLAAQPAQQGYLLRTDRGNLIDARNVDYLIADDNQETFSVVMLGRGNAISGVRTLTVLNASTTGINTVSTDKASLTISGDKVSFLGLANPMDVTVTDLSGKVLVEAKVDTGASTLNIDRLPKGVYILKTKNSAVKFLKK